MTNKRISWIIWFVLLIQFVYMMNFVMADMSSAIIDASVDPGCADIPDLSFGLSQEEVYQDLKCLGEPGRSVYKKESVQKDSLYPVSYGLFFAFTLFALSSLLFRRRWIVIVITILPLIGMLFDFLENYQLRKLMDQFPELQQGTVTLASVANIGKWSFIYVSIAFTLILAVWSLIRATGIIRKG